MNNIMASDFFRLRHGAALRNTFLGLLGMVILIVVTMALSQSDGFEMIMLDGSENMTPAEVEELKQDLSDASAEASEITGGGSIGKEMLAQSAYLLFFLPIVIAVFCADFSAGTYRNTLSYESNRNRVYLSKLALSVLLCLVLLIGMLIASWALGGVVFGFGDFSLAYFMDVLLILVLQLPLCLATIAVGHLLVAFSKKSSTTIAVFLLGFLAIGITLQLLASSFPSLEWLLLLDPQSGGKMMVQHASIPNSQIAIVLAYNLVVAAAATVVGLFHFNRTDMP